MSNALSKTNGAVALSDMDVPQLEAADVMLNQMAGHHDSANTVCCLLNGMVLLELKRRLGHSNWGPFLKKRYSKSQDTAGRRMRAATDFLSKLQDPKFRSTAEFDLQAGVDVLKQDLSVTLGELDKAKLDFAHPVVRAASLYAAGRSFYQLCLDLGPALRGGDTSKSSKPKVKKLRDEIAREEAQIVYLPLQKGLQFALQAKSKRRLLFLPIAGPSTKASLSVLRDNLAALSDLIDAAIKEVGKHR